MTTSSATSQSDQHHHARLRLVTGFLPAPQLGKAAEALHGLIELAEMSGRSGRTGKTDLN
jgi:hypothetical protein